MNTLQTFSSYHLTDLIGGLMGRQLRHKTQ